MAIRRKRPPRERPSASRVPQLPWGEIRNPHPPVETLDPDQLEQIHLASLDLLERYGMRILHAGARRLLSEAGAEVNDGEKMVRFDRGLVMEKLALAPAEITLHARNPAKNFILGGNRRAFTSVGGPA